MFRKQTALFALILCAGCHSNPYTGYDGNLQNGPIQNKSTDATSSIQAETLVDVTEGASVPVQITGRVTSGTPVFSFINLPAFASYDPTSGTLTFTPPVGAARDKAFPGGEYKLVVVLSSSLTPQLKITKEMAVVVHPSAQALVVSGFTPQAQIVEGDTFNGTITVQTSNTPVTVSDVDLPEGVKIRSTPSPTTFAVTYTPGFKTVQARSGTFCYDASGNSTLCKTFQWTLNVIDSVGESSSVAATWSVLDYRQDPSVKYTSAPEVIASTASTTTTQMGAEFSIEVEDPNGETIPSLNVVQPPNGQASIAIENSGAGTKDDLPFAKAKVTLSGFAASFQGQIETVNVSACVEDAYGNMANCKTIPVSVQF